MMADVQFVNYAGNPVSLDSSLHAKPKVKPDERSYHNGWRVVGIPKGAMEAAQASLEAEIAYATRMAEKDRSIRIPKPWDEQEWRNKFKKQPVRSKPYETPEAAEVCKQLAEKAGWTDIEVREIKKEVRSA